MKKLNFKLFALLGGLLTIYGQGALAQEATINGANTAWILTSTALVLFMTLPGLALFYGGLVRVKNILSVLMQCFAIACLVSILWLIAGYSLAFGTGNAWIGDLSMVFMANISEDALAGDIPLSLHAMYQMTFAIITPALIVGAFAERMKFSSMLIFSALWLFAVYIPVRLAIRKRLVGFRGRYSRAYHCRCGGACCCYSDWQAQWLSNNCNASAQYDDDGYWCRYAWGWVVWF